MDNYRKNIVQEKVNIPFVLLKMPSQTQLQIKASDDKSNVMIETNNVPMIVDENSLFKAYGVNIPSDESIKHLSLELLEFLHSYHQNEDGNDLICEEAIDLNPQTNIATTTSENP